MTNTVDPRADARPGARLDGPRARARDHDQGPGRARALRGARRRDLPAAPHRHARPRRLHLRGAAAAWPRARARCSSSTPRRASRPRRWPTPTSRSTPGLELIPCLNKIDLPGAEPERVAEEVAELLGEPADAILRISGKTGEGVEDVLEELVAEGPAARRRPRRAAARADLRLRVRPVPRRDRLHPRRRRRLPQGRRDPRDGRRAPRPTSTTSASSRPR